MSTPKMEQPPLYTMDSSDNRDTATNPPPPPSLILYKKARGLWYDDGNVIICAGKRKFRVYKGILSAQLKKLRDILAATDTGKVKSNEATVIMLTDDDDDLASFLSAIFKPSVSARFYKSPPSGPSLVLSLSVMRLALKYEVQPLIHQALLHIDLFFPPRQDNLITFASKMQTSKTYKVRDILKDCPGVLSVTTSSLADAHWLVPRVVYFTVLTFELDDIVVHPSYLQLSSHHQLMIVQSSVSCSIGMSHQNAWVGTLPSADCAEESLCAYVSRKAHECIQNTMPPGTKTHALNVDLKVRGGKRFCQNCQAVGTKYQQDFKDAYWTRHVEICGFKDWEEANCMRNKALTTLG